MSMRSGDTRVTEPAFDADARLFVPLTVTVARVSSWPVGFEVRSAGVATLLRTLPWLVVGAIGLGIFVFTAFAAGDRSEEPTAEPEPECVRIREDGTVRPVPCRWENDGVIDQFLPLDSDQACRHEDAMPHDAPVHNARLCLVPLAAYVRG